MFEYAGLHFCSRVNRIPFFVTEIYFFKNTFIAIAEEYKVGEATV